MRLWPESANPSMVAPEYVKKPGRPKLSRKKDKHEPRKFGKLSRTGLLMRCAVCKSPGHNKRGCPEISNQGGTSALSRKRSRITASTPAASTSAAAVMADAGRTTTATPPVMQSQVGSGGGECSSARVPEIPTTATVKRSSRLSQPIEPAASDGKGRDKTSGGRNKKTAAKKTVPPATQKKTVVTATKKRTDLHDSGNKGSKDAGAAVDRSKNPFLAAAMDCVAALSRHDRSVASEVRSGQKKPRTFFGSNPLLPGESSQEKRKAPSDASVGKRKAPDSGDQQPKKKQPHGIGLLTNEKTGVQTFHTSGGKSILIKDPKKKQVKKSGEVNIDLGFKPPGLKWKNKPAVTARQLRQQSEVSQMQRRQTRSMSMSPTKGMSTQQSKT